MKLLTVLKVISSLVLSLSLSSTLSAEELKIIHIKAGKIHESCLKLRSSESIKYNFKSSGKLAFNIHYHLGKKVKYPVKLNDITEYSGTFEASFSQQYCLMWSNKSSDTVILEYEN